MLAMVSAALLLLAAAPLAESAISCGQVYGEVTPCISYVLYSGVRPPQCCQGVRNLAKNWGGAEHQSICRCLKTATQGFSRTILEAIASIPRTCKLNISFKISHSTDCSRVE